MGSNSYVHTLMWNRTLAIASNISARFTCLCDCSKLWHAASYFQPSICLALALFCISFFKTISLLPSTLISFNSFQCCLEASIGWEQHSGPTVIQCWCVDFTRLEFIMYTLLWIEEICLAPFPFYGTMTTIAASCFVCCLLLMIIFTPIKIDILLR